jgi:hypothetical protein
MKFKTAASTIFSGQPAALGTVTVVEVGAWAVTAALAQFLRQRCRRSWWVRS